MVIPAVSATAGQTRCIRRPRITSSPPHNIWIIATERSLGAKPRPNIYQIRAICLLSAEAILRGPQPSDLHRIEAGYLFCPHRETAEGKYVHLIAALIVKRCR